MARTVLDRGITGACSICWLIASLVMLIAAQLMTSYKLNRTCRLSESTMALSRWKRVVAERQRQKSSIPIGRECWQLLPICFGCWGRGGQLFEVRAGFGWIRGRQPAF